MINVELSSIWNCLSLPDLLASEKDIFDAHYHLRTNSGAGNDFLGFLGLPDSATARTVHAVRTAAERIRQSGDTLVVAGRGGPFLAARAGIDLLLGRGRTLRGDRPRVLFTGDNLSGREFDGVLEAEPWLGPASGEYRKGKRFFLHDEAGNPVPFSILPGESLIPFGGCRIALALRIPPRGRRILKLTPEWEMDALPPEPEKTPKHPELSLRHTRGGKFSLSFRGTKFLDAFPEPQVLQDASDTWSHRMVRYAATPRRSFASPGGWKTLFSGSRAAAWISEWRDSEQNIIEAICRTDASRPGVSLEFRVNWHGGREMLKLSLKTVFPVTEHLDGCPGGTVRRPFDAKEYPFFNRLTLKGRRHSLTLVSPDIFAFDMQPDGLLRLTLLRANFYAYDDKFPMPPGNPPVLTDQGDIRFRLVLLPDAGRDLIENEIHRFTDPVRYSETTRGIRRFVPGS